MKNLKTAFYLVAVFLVGCLVLSCQKESYNPLETESEVSFSIHSSNLKSTTRLKSTEVYSLSEADKIILTIQNSDGSATKYISSEVKIQQMNGDYYTQKIVLKTGNYRLTEFVIIDQVDSTIFATPLLGSQEAQNVDSPLPITFSVAKDITTAVNVEVLSTENKKPEDFGLNRFPIVEVKTFGFMIGVADSKSDKLLAAKLTVSNGAYSYIQDLDSIANNMITIKDGLSNYTLKVEKTGYATYTHTYSLDSLKMFKDSVENLPMLVELEKVSNLSFTDGFEDDVFNNFWTIEGTSHAEISSEKFHSGSRSIKMTAIQNNVNIVTHEYSIPMKGRISVWFFDEFAGQYGPYSKLVCYTSASYGNGNMFGLGVDDWLLDKYVTSCDIPGASVNTSINRTFSWHKFEIFFNISQVEFYIDSTLVNIIPGNFSFNKIDLYTSYHNGSFYFDDFSVIPQ